MKLGIHAYAWCSQWSNDTLDLIDNVQRLGLDFIELPLMRLDTFDARRVKERLVGTGMEATTSTALLSGYDVTSSDSAERANGIAYLKACVQATHDVGSGLFTGVIYSEHVKQSLRRPDERDWQLAADALREVAIFARELGVTVGLEPVNRYETYLLNTSEQALLLKEMIGEPNVKLHLDTYHMNIEEKSYYDAVIRAREHIVHLHLCENDRGIPGTGLVEWDDLFRALGEIGYDGYAALESFVDCTDNMNTWVWRQLAPSGETLVQEGIAFIKSKMKQHGLE